MGFLQRLDTNIDFLKLYFYRDEKGQKSSRRLDQSIMYEAEHDYLLKSLEKNLEIPKDCTYADQKAIDEEVSTQEGPLLLESVLIIRKASPRQAVLATLHAILTGSPCDLEMYQEVHCASYCSQRPYNLHSERIGIELVG